MSVISTVGKQVGSDHHLQSYNFWFWLYLNYLRIKTYFPQFYFSSLCLALFLLYLFDVEQVVYSNFLQLFLWILHYVSTKSETT